MNKDSDIDDKFQHYFAGYSNIMLLIIMWPILGFMFIVIVLLFQVDFNLSFLYRACPNVKTAILCEDSLNTP